jgi:hypothetical protein
LEERIQYFMDVDALCPEDDEVHRLMFEVPVVIRVTARLD